MEPVKKSAAILLAAGSGIRLGSNVPKQYLVFQKKEVFLHALEPILKDNRFGCIVIVVRREWLKKAKGMVRRSIQDDRIRFVVGSPNRRKSIEAGLHNLKEQEIDYVLFHDAARPLANEYLFNRAIAGAKRYGAAIVGTKVDGLPVRIKRSQVVEILDAKSRFMTETPECYRLDWLKNAHKNFAKNLEEATNLQLMLRAGYTVKFIKHTDRNPKLTHPGDIHMIDAILKYKKKA